MDEEKSTEDDGKTERIEKLDEEKKIELNPERVNLDRPGGLLTDTDRRYLVGKKEYKHQQSDAKRRQEIRKRVVNGILDFSLLLYYLEKEEKDKIFSEFDDQTLSRSLGDLLAFIYTGIGQDNDRFEEIVKHGVAFGSNFDESGRWVGDVLTVDVEIDILDITDTDRLYEELLIEEYGHGRYLSPEKIGLLVRDGKLSEDDLDRIQHVRNYPGGPVRSPTYHSDFRADVIMEMKKGFDEKEEGSFEEFLEDNEHREGTLF